MGFRALEFNFFLAFALAIENIAREKSCYLSATA